MISDLPNPLDLVAKVLKVERDTLDDNAAMGVHPHWDSLNQVEIVTALETEYKIEVPNADMLKYSNLKAIKELFEELVRRGHSAK